MGDGVLFIGWTRSVRGREQAAQKVFQEALGLFGQLQASGRIESFEAVLLDSHGGDLGGFMLLRGAREGLAAVRVSPDFERLNARAGVVVEGFGVVGGVTGEALAARMALFQEAAGELA